MDGGYAKLQLTIGDEALTNFALGAVRLKKSIHWSKFISSSSK